MTMTAAEALQIDEANLRMVMRQHTDNNPGGLDEAQRQMIIDRAVKALKAMLASMTAVLDDDCAEGQKLPTLALVCRFGSDTLEQLGDMMAQVAIQSLMEKDPDWILRFLTGRR